MFGIRSGINDVRWVRKWYIDRTIMQTVIGFQFTNRLDDAKLYKTELIANTELRDIQTLKSLT